MLTIGHIHITCLKKPVDSEAAAPCSKHVPVQAPVSGIALLNSLLEGCDIRGMDAGWRWAVLANLHNLNL